MNRRDLIAGATLAAIVPAVASSSGKACDPLPGPNTLNAAGTLLLLAQAEHGADGLRMAMLALVSQAAPC